MPCCADALQVAGVACFGPTAAAAQLESSKAFCKDFFKRHNIPTAAYETFTDFASAEEYIRSVPHRVVVKASGLAAGKGKSETVTRIPTRSSLPQIVPTPIRNTHALLLGLPPQVC